jgi:hypothetical protein
MVLLFVNFAIIQRMNVKKTIQLSKQAKLKFIQKTLFKVKIITPVLKNKVKRII